MNSVSSHTMPKEGTRRHPTGVVGQNRIIASRKWLATRPSAAGSVLKMRWWVVWIVAILEWATRKTSATFPFGPTRCPVICRCSALIFPSVLAFGRRRIRSFAYGNAYGNNDENGRYYPEHGNEHNDSLMFYGKPRYCSSSRKLQMWSVIPASMAGVTRRLLCIRQKL